MRYAHPGTEGAIVSFKSKYGNYIGGEFVAPCGDRAPHSLRFGGMERRDPFGDGLRTCRTADRIGAIGRIEHKKVATRHRIPRGLANIRQQE